jgi:hypothetical protein
MHAGMAAETSPEASELRTQITGISRELLDIESRQLDLEREKREAFVRLSDDVLDWWVRTDLEERRWNAVPPPTLAASGASR